MWRRKRKHRPRRRAKIGYPSGKDHGDMVDAIAFALRPLLETNKVPGKLEMQFDGAFGSSIKYKVPQ